MNIDHQRVGEIIQETAELEIMPLWQNLESHHVDLKQPDDAVTIADRASEERLTEALQALLPGSLVIMITEKRSSSSPFTMVYDTVPSCSGTSTE